MTASSSADAAVRDRLTAHSTYIDGLINMIPAKFYFPPDPDEMAKKYQKYTGKVPKAPKHERKLAAIERKKERLDPNQPDATSRIGVDDDSGEDDEGEDEAAGDDDVDEQEGDSDDGDDDDEADEDAGDALESSTNGRSAKRPASAQAQRNASAAKKAPRPEPTLDAAGRLESGAGDEARAAGPDGLRERLTERLALMRGSRGGAPKAAGERAAAAAAKGKKVKKPKHVAGGRNAHGGADGAEGTGSDAQAAQQSAATARGSSGAASIEFNKLAAAAAEPGKAKKRKLTTAALLAKAEEAERRKQARLNAPDGGGEDAQIGEWNRALQKASGIKQRDNPTLLRKALKRKERTKKKSAKEWSSRIKTVAKGMAEKQEKRKQNLSDRKTKNKTRASKNKDKAPARAGFEGKKGRFFG